MVGGDTCYDTVVVGGGPAGSTLAYRLAGHGLRVAVLDKATFPRVKPCGGGLDGTFMAHLPQGMTVDGVVEERIRHAYITLNGALPRRSYEVSGFVAMTQRRRLDHHLLSQAVEAGATLMEGERVSRVERCDDVWTVQANGTSVRGRVLVGADGAYSTVARALGLQGRRYQFVAAEWDLCPTDEAHLHRWYETVLIDFRLQPLGYYWIFPKKEHLNVGWGVPRKWAKGIHDMVDASSRRRGLDGQACRYAHHIPFYRDGDVIRDAVLLVGDAAGAIDPATGAGIGAGVRTASAASEAVVAYLNGDHQGLYRYQTWFEDTLVPELRAAEALRNCILLHLALRHRESPGLMRDLLRVIGGELTYAAWAHAHPALYRIGRLAQRLVDRKMAG